MRIPEQGESCGVSYIYALCEPQGRSIRYIGATGNLARRQAAHWAARFTGATPKDRWVQRLAASGERPTLIVLACVDDRLAPIAEYYWITMCVRARADLLNAAYDCRPVDPTIWLDWLRRAYGDSGAHAAAVWPQRAALLLPDGAAALPPFPVRPPGWPRQHGRDDLVAAADVDQFRAPRRGRPARSTPLEQR